MFGNAADIGYDLIANSFHAGGTFELTATNHVSLSPRAPAYQPSDAELVATADRLASDLKILARHNAKWPLTRAAITKVTGVAPQSSQVKVLISNKRK